MKKYHISLKGLGLSLKSISLTISFVCVFLLQSLADVDPKTGLGQIDHHINRPIDSSPAESFIFEKEFIQRDQLGDDTTKLKEADIIHSSTRDFLERTGRNSNLNVLVTSHNEDYFPQLLATVAVTDINGDPISGLTTNNFSLTEGGDVISLFTVEQIDEYSPIAVTLVIDRSGSMTTLVPGTQFTRLDVVKQAASDFVRKMTAGDRVAIVSFSSGVTVNQEMTSDKDALLDAIDLIQAGGGTHLLDGLYVGLQQVQCETGIRAVIGLSDGETLGDQITEEQLVAFALQLSVPIHTIYIGDPPELGWPLMEDIAAQTNGLSFKIAAVNVGIIYDYIKNSMLNQYLVSYSTLKPETNGTERTTSILVEYGGNIAGDTYNYFAPTASTLPPQIELTIQTNDLIGSNQAPNQNILVDVNVYSQTIIQEVTLFCRTISTNGQNNEYLAIPMYHSETIGEIYCYAYIPGLILQYPLIVQYPGVEFFITTCDDTPVSISSPSFPYLHPYSFAVSPNEVPVIVHTPVNSSQAELPVTIDAKITDGTDYVNVTELYFRVQGGGNYIMTPMTQTSAGNYTAEIPASFVILPGVEYFIYAEDNYGVAASHGTWDNPHFIDIVDITLSFTPLADSYCETSPPVILEGTPSGGIFSGPGIQGNIFYPSIVDPSVPTQVTIYYRYYYNGVDFIETSQTTTVNPSEFGFVAVNPSCSPGGDGSITFDVTEGSGQDYKFFWTTTNGSIPLGQEYNQTIHPVPVGSYFVEFFDMGYECPPQNKNITLLHPEINVSVVNLTVCDNLTTVVQATTIVNVTPYTPRPTQFEYTWTEILPTGNIIVYTGIDIYTTEQELAPGNYHLMVTDQTYFCSSEVTFTVISAPIDVTIGNIKQVTCFKANDGEATAYALGGTPPYYYKWYQVFPTGDELIVSGSSQAKDLGPGNYYVTVTDKNGLGCTVTSDEIEITEPGLLAINEPIAVDLCLATVIISGGTPEYTYTWYKDKTIEPGGFHHYWEFLGNKVTSSLSIEIDQLGVGEYKIIVDDANGCGQVTSYFSVGEVGFTKEYHICFRFKGRFTPPEPEYPPDPIPVNSYVQNVIKSISSRSIQCISSANAEMESEFTRTCGDPDAIKDELILSYEQNPYHYTLYYYDRAGNLVRTVPPKGVDSDVVDRTELPEHIMVTEYDYNSIKQVVRQKTPDGNESKFIYDQLGRIRFSQNAEQESTGVLTFSYTKYDNLGRIIEVGECRQDGLLLWEHLKGNASSMSYPDESNSTLHNSQQVYTHYSVSSGITYYGKAQRFLDNRISYTETADGVATYYSYDPHGNVEWIVQYIPGFRKNYIGYEYDLISGNVTMVKYNEQYTADRFFHKYAYDEDNRIVTVKTSRDGYLWDTDGTYAYYPHGPLKNMVLGQDKLQKTDYAYTINGWLKATNHPSQIGSEINDGFPGDIYGTSLQYYAKDISDPNDPGDYVTSTSSDNFVADHSYNTQKRLYNGNIVSWTGNYNLTSMPTPAQDLFKHKTGSTGFTYTYDKLNRIKESTFAYNNGTGWVTNPANEYNSAYTYDANGNITTLERNIYNDGINDVQMDRLEYHYDNITPNNQLTSVKDLLSFTIGNSTDGTQGDITGIHNYNYDKNGNLESDIDGTQESIANIDWNIFGKVIKVEHVAGSSLPKLEFTYDAAGNRVKKKRTYPGTNDIITDYYVRDAQGNIMAIYTHTYDPNSVNRVFHVVEQPIYGSSRLGSLSSGATIVLSNDATTIEETRAPTTTTAEIYNRRIGQKSYELTDHLGNVRAVIHDYLGTTNYTTFAAQIKTVSDYYAFGMQMPGRFYMPEDYRFGFNGKEKDNDVNGTGTVYDYGFRIYDARIAKFLSLDPLFKSYPWYTPYQFAGNSPIVNVDLDGREELWFMEVLIDIYLSKTKLKQKTDNFIKAQTGTGDFNNPVIPKHIRDVNNTLVTVDAATAYGELFVDFSEFTMEAVASIPGAETVGDAVMAVYYGIKGEDENALAYAAGLVLPGVSGKAIKELKGSLHHIFTNKNFIRGQQWSKKFMPMFERAGYNLDDAINKINVPGHKGPHPEEYHQAVYDELRRATEGLEGDDYKEAFDESLEYLQKEVTTEGSDLNKMLRKEK